MSKIVISYRREDADGHAGRLFDALSTHFGRDEVLRDLDSIPFGVDFEKHLNEEIEKCQALLVVIGPHWIDIKDENGKRRLDHPRDWVTMEVKAALKRPIPVIPVTVNGAVMPSQSELPAAIADLAKRQKCELSAAHWNAGVDDLIDGLDRSIQDEDPEPPAAGNVFKRLGIPFLSALLIAIGGVAAYLLMKDDPLSPVRVTASSTAASGRDACDRTTEYPASNSADGDPETAWRTAGDGLGESMRFEFDGEVSIGRIGLIPGYAKVDPCDDTDRFQENRVIERVAFTFDDGSSTIANYQRVPRLQWTSVSQVTSYVIIEILETSRSGGRDYTAISEVEFVDDEAG